MSFQFGKPVQNGWYVIKTKFTLNRKYGIVRWVSGEWVGLGGLVPSDILGWSFIEAIGE